MGELLKANFDPEQVVDLIIRDGAVSVHLIPDDFLNDLHSQVARTLFRGTAFPSKFNTRILKPLEGPAKDLNDQLESLVNDGIRVVSPDVLIAPLHFNTATVGRLDPRAEVSKHGDSDCSGLVVFSLLDEGRDIYVSPTDEQFMANRRPVSTNAGDVVFMRGLGFAGLETPIPHQVTRKKTPPGFSYSIVYRNQKVI